MAWKKKNVCFMLDGNLISNWTNKVSDAIYILNPQKATLRVAGGEAEEVIIV
jgi:hypothetical protein